MHGRGNHYQGMELKDKVALVTGSSQGIGQAIAERLAKDGANIVIDYRSHDEGANETRRKVEAVGARAIVVKADLASLDRINFLVDEALGAFGRVDILVNNAGIEKRNDYLDVTEQEFNAVMDVNLKGVFFMTQRFVK